MALPSYDHLGRPQAGNVFIKFFIALGIIVVAGVLSVLFCGGMVNNVSGRAHDLAQAEAVKFLRTAGINGIVQCAGTDSDGDGYISCPYTTHDGTIHPLECAAAMTINTGCRPPKAVFQQLGTTPR